MERGLSSTGHRIFPNGHFALKAGTVAKVKDCANGYPLPLGLKPGDTVRVLAFDCGYYTVEKGDRTFNVFLTNIGGR
jgi:hypothetical protein